MKKIVLIVLFLLGLSAFSIEVDKNLLLNIPEKNIEFDNYIGPYLFYNTIDEIRAIGSSLASGIDPLKKSTGNYADKYKSFHTPKLEWEVNQISCDIIEITNLSLVDNIANIELIISQYLIDLYGYSIDDADLLAHLLVLYNATYRGSIEHISTNYTSESLISTNQDFIGIDLHYYNWAGKTFIYIPLSDNILLGDLSNVDSDILLDNKVIENIKIEDSKDIEFREEIVEFKEREFDAIVEDINSETEVLKIMKEESVIQQEKSELIEDLVDKLPTDEKTTTENSNIEIIEKEKQIQEKKEDLNKKEEIILALRDELADDKNNLISDVKKNNSKDGFNFIINRLQNNKILGQIVNLNINGEINYISQVNSIRNNSFNIKGDVTYVIAGGDNDNQIITLGKLKSENFEVISWSETPCYENSPIIVLGNFIYVEIFINNDIYIGEFDTDLKLLRKSPLTIIKDSFIVLKNNIFYIQGKNNNIELVNLSDFQAVSMD